MNDVTSVTETAPITRTASMMTSSELSQRAMAPKVNRNTMHLSNLVRDTRPTGAVWDKVQKDFWSRQRHQFNDQSKIDLGTFEHGIGFELVWSLRWIRGMYWVIATLTPTEDKGRTRHTNLTMWQCFMKHSDFTQVKKEQQL